MKIDPASRAGKHLLGEPHGAHGPHSWGVDREDLERTHFIRFNWQFGDAFTLPIPFLGTVVLIKSRFLESEGGELKDTPDLWLVRHELCHAAQIRRWGGLKYLFKHLWARIHTRSILVVNSDVEAPCYEVHERFRQETF